MCMVDVFMVARLSVVYLVFLVQKVVASLNHTLPHSIKPIDHCDNVFQNSSDSDYQYHYYQLIIVGC